MTDAARSAGAQEAIRVRATDGDILQPLQRRQEPTGQLDPETADGVLDLLFDMQDTADTALLTISHDRRLRSRFDDVVLLENGTTTLAAD